MFDDRYMTIKCKLPCLITTIGEMGPARYLSVGGIFDAYKKEIKVLGRDDLDVADENIGLKGSPTNVVKSFPTALKGQGTVKELDAKAGADWLLDCMEQKHII
jgi:electron transfer flavoprotein beta subunit